MKSFLTTAPVATKSSPFFGLLVAAIAAVVATGGATAQAVIPAIGGQVHFPGNGVALAATDSAGVFPQTNYNIITAPTNNPNVTNGPLNDNSGNPTTATLSTTGAGFFFTSSSPPSGNDEKLNSGLIYNNAGPTITLTFNNIPYANYSLYIYSIGNAVYSEKISVSGGATYYQQMINGGGAGYVDGNPLTSYTYIQATTTTNILNPASADYILFTGLTGSSQTVTLDSSAGIGSGGSQPIFNGFQIVAPEPASLGLLAVGGLRAAQAAAVNHLLTNSTF